MSLVSLITHAIVVRTTAMTTATTIMRLAVNCIRAASFAKWSRDDPRSSARCPVFPTGEELRRRRSGGRFSLTRPREMDDGQRQRRPLDDEQDVVAIMPPGDGRRLARAKRVPARLRDIALSPNRPGRENRKPSGGAIQFRWSRGDRHQSPSDNRIAVRSRSCIVSPESRCFH